MLFAISPVSVRWEIFAILLLTSVLSSCRATQSRTEHIIIHSTEIPASKRQFLGVRLQDDSGRFVAISNRLDSAGEAEGEPRAIQTFRLQEDAGSFTVNLEHEFLQPELLRPFRIEDNGDVLSWRGLNFLDDINKDQQIARAFRNDAEIRDYPFPENFKDVFLLDPAPGRPGQRGQSLVVDSTGRHLVIKTLDGNVVQLWQQEDELKQVALPASELREINMTCNDAAEVLFITADAKIYGLDDNLDSLTEKSEFEWIRLHSAIINRVFQNSSYRMVASREIAALVDRETRRIHVLLLNGETAELEMFSSADQTPAGRRRSDKDHAIDLKYPNRKLAERKEMADNQVSLYCSLMVYGNNSIAVIDRDYQRVLVVSPKVETVE
ncbi:hypothetical protein KDL44_07515 [bacterium]|nr:hypothetical protein [bacterium]